LGFKSNVASVFTALITRYGIPAKRLKSYDVASLAPVASNDSEEGKAENRRVELDKQQQQETTKLKSFFYPFLRNAYPIGTILPV